MHRSFNATSWFHCIAYGTSWCPYCTYLAINELGFDNRFSSINLIDISLNFISKVGNKVAFFLEVAKHHTRQQDITRTSVE